MPQPVAVRPAPARTRPAVVHEHRQLFREPVYADGQPYARDEDDEEDVIITA